MSSSRLPLGTTSFSDKLAIEIAMAGGIGRIKKAPGTFGSLPGLLVGAGIHAAATPLLPFSLAAYHATIVLLLATVTALAYWSIAQTERVLHVHDDQRIVVDEVAGQAIAVAWMPRLLLAYFAAFLLFRLFDISKPSLIGKIDRDVAGAWGTLGDDLLAGAVAAVIGAALLYFLPEGLV